MAGKWAVYNGCGKGWIMGQPIDRYIYAAAVVIVVGLAYLFANPTGCPFPLAIPLFSLLAVGLYRLYLKVFW